MNWEEDKLYHSNHFSEHEIQLQPLGPDFFHFYAYTSHRTPSSRWPISPRALPALFPVSHLQHVMKHQHPHPLEDKSPNDSYPHQEGNQISMSSTGCFNSPISILNRLNHVLTQYSDLQYPQSMISLTPPSHINPQNSLPSHIQCSSHIWRPFKQRSGG